jgi:hypothetical protein
MLKLTLKLKLTLTLTLTLQFTADLQGAFGCQSFPFTAAKSRWQVIGSA